MTTERTSLAYGRRADEYIDLFGTIEAAAPEDRELVRTWARGLSGPILDVGCGPGQWTNWLREQGSRVTGIDPTPEFVASAQHRFSDSEFRTGRAEDLGVADASLAGVLAWFSLIHTPPQRIPGVLIEFARCVAPGGGLLLGFCEGPEIAPFDHAVITAYYWPIDELARAVEAAGFTVTRREARQDPGMRRVAAIAATR